MSPPGNNLQGSLLRTSAGRILLALLLTDITFAIIYLLTYEHSSQYLVSAFHLDFEKNIPATYSALKLIAAGTIALSCAFVDRRHRFRRGPFGFWTAWLAVGGLLVLMGIDEYVAYHEGFGQELYDWGIIPYGENTIAGYAWPWTVYGAAFSVLIGIPLALMIWKVFSENRSLFRLLLLAGLIFVAGALGFENIRVYMVSYHDGLGANILMILEELCEMCAVSLTIYVFLRYRAFRVADARKEQLSFSPRAGSSESTA